MDYTSPDFKRWLDKLQQESWQLELLISGFAIFGLFTAIDFIEIKYFTSQRENLQTISNLWIAANVSAYIFLFNLIVHVLLRGMWIGAIGLRYVSGDIDYNNLNYTPKFTDYLKRKVGSFDKYISQLENYCSILFSMTFLLVFYFLGVITITILVGLIINLLRSAEFIPFPIFNFLRWSILLVFGLSSIIVFIDFIGLGILKKKNWTSKLYFPIYWVFSKLTLSFLYRPITYNFLDNKLGRKVSFLMLPVYILILIVSTFDYVNSNYLTKIEGSSVSFGDNINYENEIIDETLFMGFAAIPSKVIEVSYLKIFMPFSSAKEDFVFEINESLKPEKDIRGFETNAINFKTDSTVQDFESRKKQIPDYLKAINKLYTLKIDSQIYTSEFIIAKNVKESVGFETYLDIEDLPKGKHLLTIIGPYRTKENRKDSIQYDKTLVEIPFWYYPQ